MPHGLVSPLEKVAMRKLKPCLAKLRLREVSGPRMSVFDLYRRLFNPDSLAADMQEYAS
jgi:hypothetical protein